MGRKKSATEAKPRVKKQDQPAKKAPVEGSADIKQVPNQKDKAEKNLINIAENFADIINGLIFKGKQVIKPEDLVDVSMWSVLKEENGLHEQERDCGKIWVKNTGSTPIRICVLGIENQTLVDWTMPFRVISYDGATYKLMMNQNQELCPVITIVLYFGKTKWNAPQSICEYLEDKISELPPEMRSMMNDYKANVFDISHMDPTEFEYFKGDFKHVAKIVYAEAHGEQYEPADTDVVKNADAFLKFLQVITKDSQFEAAQKFYDNMKGEAKMCDVISRFVEQGKTQCRNECVENMLRENTDIGYIERVMHVTREQILEIAKNCGLNPVF